MAQPRYFLTTTPREIPRKKTTGENILEFAGSFLETKAKIKKEKQATYKEFFNIYASLRNQGMSEAIAQEQARRMTGYTGKDFVSPGFEEAVKLKQKQAQEKAQLGLEKSRLDLETSKVGIAKTQADILKTQFGTGEDFQLNQELRTSDPRTTSFAKIAKLKQRFPGKVKQIENFFDVSSVKRSEEVEGLTPNQITSGNKLAKELFGASALRTKDSFNNIVKPIYDRMRAGETIDEIADDLRIKGQSPEFTGAIRDAAQQVTSNLSDTKTQAIFDKLDDTLTKNNLGKTRSFLKQLAIKSSTADEAKNIKGKERTIEFLSEVEQDLKNYENKGGDTNIFTGNIEEIARKIGTVRDPELRTIATKILTARQKYRRAMTGVAFSPGEDLEYDRLFPSIDKTVEFNTATIDGLREAFQGDVDFFYSFAMGEDAYNTLFKEGIQTEEDLGGGVSIDPTTGQRRDQKTDVLQIRDRQMSNERIMRNPRTGQRIIVQVDQNNNPIIGTERII
jgi:hypothetical protein